MNSEDQEFDVIVSSLSKHTGTRKNKITRETRLFHDLSLSGDDVDEYLDDLTEKFGTDWDDLDFYKYFPDETQALGAWVAKLFRRVRYVEITVSDIERAVEGGKWMEVNI